MVAFEGRQLSVALLLVALATSAHGYCQSLQCPAPNGYFAHPQSCLSYVKCVDGEAFVKECPADLHFNPTTGMCDKPEDSQCVDAEKELSGSCEVVQTVQVLRSEPSPGIQCDCGKCCRKAVETDCSAFYECDGDGNAILKHCHTGLVFNPIREDCDLPENYQCPFVQECKCKCRYPVDGECKAYYRCDGDSKFAEKEYCPEGLHFSEEKQICTFPNLANCDVPATTPTTPEECSTLSDTKADCKHWAANGDCKCDPFKSGDCSWQKYVKKHCPASCGCGTIEIITTTPTTDVCDGLLKCPEPYGEFPHPKSCTKWVHCSHNIPYIKDCPADLHFNPKLRVCDWPNSATCSAKSSGDCTISTVPTVKPTDTVTSQTPTIDDECDGLLKCPEPYGEFPHPKSCTKWVHCSHNIPYIKDCPANLHFNPKLRVCDWPNSATCSAKSNGDCTISTVPTVKPTEPSVAPSSSALPKDCALGNLECCAIDCSKGTYWPHPHDCKKFIQCAPYGPQEMPCAAGTRWDQDKLTCDHEWRTPCKTGNYLNNEKCGGTPKPTDPEVTTPVGVCEDRLADCKHYVANGDCICDPFKNGDCSWQKQVQRDCAKSCSGCGKFTPTAPSTSKPSTPVVIPEDKCEGLLKCPQRDGEFPHPNLCTKWVHCSNNIPYVKDCPANLHFDSELRVCNYPEKAACSAKQDGDCTIPDTTEPTEEPETGVCEDRMADCKHYAANGDCVCNPFRSGDCSWQKKVLKDCPKSCTGCGKFEPTTPSTPIVDPDDECEGKLKCPKVNGEFPHPSFCNKWVHCSNNIPYVKDCPASLHFDPVLRVCNWQNNAVCFAEEGNDDCTVPDVTTPTESPIDPPEICDCDCCLRPHPDDCTSYYYCDGGRTEFHTCSDGLVFHPDNETCVYASDYPECKIEPEPECNCECFEPSEICSEYWQCRGTGGKAEKKVCSGDLHFNPSTHACDYAENVDCVSPSKRETGLLSRRQQPISASDCAKLPNGRYSAGSSSEFFNCFNSVAFLLKCQEGTAFDAATSKCVRT